MDWRYVQTPIFIVFGMNISSVYADAIPQSDEIESFSVAKSLEI
jgi:hypothetical protein